MITGDIKSKVDKIWDDIYSYGLSNPLKVIEQLTYLFFIKSLDDRELEYEKNAAYLGIKFEPTFSHGQQSLRWSIFKLQDPKTMHETIATKVFPFIRQLSTKGGYAKYLADIVYELPSPIITDKVVKAVDALPLKDRDLKGDIYEYCLGKLQTAGQLGQFRTPRHIIRMMVELTSPKLGDIICDPALGTAGFLVSACEYIKEHNQNELVKSDKAREQLKNMFYGYDTDPSMLRIAAMNILMHDVSTDNIAYRDSLNDDNQDTNKYTLVLANPPFKGSLDTESIAPSLKRICDTTKTELLFVSLFLRSLEAGGRCACIVPDGVLFGSNKAYRQLRTELIEKHKLQAIISMPSGVFKPYAGVSTAVVLFTKTGTGGTDDVWFYDMKSDGYTLDDKRTQISDGTGDIPDIIARFKALDAEKNRTRYDQSFMVSKADLIANNYDLSINKYKLTHHEQVNLAHPLETIAKIKELEGEIMTGLGELELMIKGEK